MKKKTARFIILLSFILSGILILQFLLSDGGVMTYRTLNRQLKSLNNEVENLRVQKKKLTEEIWRLSSDDEYIEKIARRDYDLLKKNELILKFVEMEK